MDPATLRLKRLRESVEPRFSIRSMAAALGVPASTYAAYEDPNKFKKTILPFDLTKRIANVLAEKGVDYDTVMELAGLDRSLSSRVREEQAEFLPITAVVAAGVWREHADLPAEEKRQLEVGPSPIPGAERFAMRMEGSSMDLTIPPGSDLECLRVAYGEIEPQAGDLVIVERTKHDLTELTCKRLDIAGDEWILRGESTKPEFREPIRIGKPDPDVFTDEEVRVIGIVIKAHQEHFRRR